VPACTNGPVPSQTAASTERRMTNCSIPIAPLRNGKPQCERVASPPPLPVGRACARTPIRTRAYCRPFASKRRHPSLRIVPVLCGHHPVARIGFHRAQHRPMCLPATPSSALSRLWLLVICFQCPLTANPLDSGPCPSSRRQWKTWRCHTTPRHSPPPPPQRYDLFRSR
jgi:hypothetical protein